MTCSSVEPKLSDKASNKVKEYLQLDDKFFTLCQDKDSGISGYFWRSDFVPADEPFYKLYNNLEERLMHLNSVTALKIVAYPKDEESKQAFLNIQSRIADLRALLRSGLAQGSLARNCFLSQRSHQVMLQKEYALYAIIIEVSAVENMDQLVFKPGFKP